MQTSGIKNPHADLSASARLFSQTYQKQKQFLQYQVIEFCYLIFCLYFIVSCKIG